MVIGIFGESCTGKSTIVQCIADRTPMAVYAGKDYLRMAKNEQEAAQKFMALLADPAQKSIFVISEKAQLNLLPEDALRVLVTAPLSLVQSRFAERMGGKLPPPVAAMLEKKHGAFDAESCDLHIESDKTSAGDAAEAVLRLAAERMGTIA